MIYATFGYPLRWVIATYDVDGLAVDADAVPTAAMRFNGAASSQIPTITKRAATTGLYDASCAITLALAQGDIIEALVSVVIDGKTYQRVYEWAVVDRPSTNTIAAAVRTWLPEIARLDEPVSSRLASASFTAPDNSAIAAIKAKTDNLPTSPASTADVQITFDPTITVQPTVLSSESVTAIAAPILAAIDEIEIDTVPSVDEIAQRLLVDPANKLLTDASGYVIAANVSEENGQYLISVVVTAGGSGVENVLITIPGTTRRYLTDAFGGTNIPADDGTYDLRITPPPGYEPVADVTVTVAGGNEQLPIELVPRPIVIEPPAGTCALTVRVASQSGTTLAGIPVTAKLPKGYAVTADTLNLNTTESQPTDSEGLATLILLRNQPYDLTAKRLDQGAVTLRIQTPDAEQATLSQVIQV